MRKELIEELEAYVPFNEQEEKDRSEILRLLKTKEDENSNVAWFGLDEALERSSEPWMVERIYRKLNDKLRAL